ncbi:uncharacterized protein VTP21DRAFT_10049 [Calcarisporiella thermophila]|uniref:uncharacterized protein n=1 Tax=Calcarisporiella thermophila TaxID=911321 RepID=UPI0037430BC0
MSVSKLDSLGNDVQSIQLKSSFVSVRTIESIYSGGKVSIIQGSDKEYGGDLLIATVGEDINIIELESGLQKFRLKGDTEIITTFAAKPNGKHLVSASRSLVIKIWDLLTGQIIRSFKAHDAPVIAMDIDSTSTLVATGSADSTVKVWDIDRGYCTHNFKGHGGVVSAVRFHPDKKRWMLVSGADDCQIRLWDLQKRSCLAVLESHVSVIRGLDFTNDGNRLVSGSRDKVVNVWDLQDYKLINTFPVYETLETVGVLENGISVNNDGTNQELFYTGGEKGVVRIWDLKSGKLVQSEKDDKATRYINDIVYLRHKRCMAVVTSDQNILFYNLDEQLSCTKQVVGYNDEIIDAAYIGSEEQHLALATNSEQIRVFHLEKYDCDLVLGHTDIVLCLDRTRDGTMLASGSKDRTARLWAINIDAQEREKRYRCLAVCVGHTEAISAIALPKKSNSFILTASQDHTVKCWDISNIDKGKEDLRPRALYTLKAHEKDINSICVAPNDKLFATGSQDKTAKIWSRENGQLLGTCHGHKRGVWCVQFSPIDKVLATSSGDKTIRIWSLNDFSCLKTFEGHTNSVLKVSFISAGMQLMSCGSDGLVKLWTIKTSECNNTLDNHTEKIWAMAIRKDEKMVVTGGADSVVNFWEDRTKQEQEQELKEKEEKILMEQDLANYLLKKDYRNAIALAMSLNQPYRLLGLFTELLNNVHKAANSIDAQQDCITGSQELDEILSVLTKEQIEKLLEYVRDWNTNSKHSRVAQTILYALLHTYSSDQLVEISGFKEMLIAMLPYTERHYKRADELLTASFLVDYTLHSMDALLGYDNDAQPLEMDLE